MADEPIENADLPAAPDIETLTGEAIQAITDETIILPAIPYHLVEKHHNKTTKLLSNSGTDTKIESRNRWHDYDFHKPLFVAFIRVNTSGFSDHHEFNFKVKLENGQKQEINIRKSGDTYTAPVNEYVTSISFKPPSVWLSNPDINRVLIWGFYKDDVSSFLRHFAHIERVKEDVIREISNQKAELDKSAVALAAKEVELSEIDTEIQERRRDLEATKIDLASEVQRNSELKSQNATIAV